MVDRRDSAVIDTVIDAARVADDFVRGVLENAAGRAGGAEHADRGWRRLVNRAGGVLGGERSVVRAMAAGYGPEQLRKAADAADELVVAAAALADTWTPAAAAVATRLAALQLHELPEVLRDPATSPSSPALRDVHERLSRAIAALHEGRSAAILHEMRSARDRPPA